METQLRWYSKAFWIFTTGQILALMELLGVFKMIGIDFGLAGKVVALVIEIVFTFLNGMNNPTNRTGW